MWEEGKIKAMDEEAESVVREEQRLAMRQFYDRLYPLKDDETYDE